MPPIYRPPVLTRRTRDSVSARGDGLGVLPPEPAWGAHFQVRPLTGWSPSMVGELRYAQPFRDLG